MLAQAAMWEKLDQESVDVLVIGGGINGAGIARDAANRGLKVALVEMRDLAYGTSSRSSKMVHGGLRYLEQFAFGLVFESVSERRILLKIAPHLVRPSRCLRHCERRCRYRHHQHQSMINPSGAAASTSEFNSSMGSSLSAT